MRALILYNPGSGRGQGERTAGLARDLVVSRGGEAGLFRLDTRDAAALRQRLAGAIVGMDVLIVAGGDGTLHAALPAVLESGVAVYHLAMGTENLFARQFGMDGSHGTLERALAGGRTLEVDAGTLAVPEQPPHPFVLMCSVGPDAGVIRRLDASRRGPITHLSYLRPVVAELCRPSLPRLTIEVDGRVVVEDRPGMAVVANSRQYAARIDPALNASMTDGLLDVVFFPAGGRLALAAWVVRSRLRRHLSPSLTYLSGRSVRVTAPASSPPAAYQLDGECGRHAFAAGVDMRLEVRPRALRVLTPPPGTPAPAGRP